jgi:hypothetical protein
VDCNNNTGTEQLQLQYLARQSRATHKGARGSWGTWNKAFTRQNAIKKFEKNNVVIAEQNNVLLAGLAANTQPLPCCFDRGIGQLLG